MLPMPAPFLSLFLLSPATDGWLGVFLDPERNEAVVAEVIPDSPAAKAGLAPGDVLLAVGDVATPTGERFAAVIRAAKAGDRISIKIRRGGAEQIVVVKLGQRPDQPAGNAPPAATKPARPQAPAPADEPAAAAPRGYLGLSVRESEGVVVVEKVLPDSPAAAAGVQVGEVITRAGDVRITGLADLDGVLQPAKAGSQLALSLRSDAGTRSVLVTLGRRPEAAGPTAIGAAPPAAAAATAPETAGPSGPRNARREVDLEAELQALRAELADLRRQIEALRQGKGRE